LILLLIEDSYSRPQPHSHFLNDFFRIIQQNLTGARFSIQSNPNYNTRNPLPKYTTNNFKKSSLETNPLPSDADKDITQLEIETGEYTLTKEEEYLVFNKEVDIDYSHNESFYDAPNK